jgi:hypothetical protein
MRFPILIRVCLLVGLLATAGCGSGGNERYIPPEQTSRQALETALTAWQNGKPPGPVADGKPAIQAVDSKWQAGQKLGKWEIVGEEAGSGPTFFSVRLTLKGSPKQQVVRYVVVGRDPLWVYREDDYKTGAGM